jgi:inhibitor of KinA
MSACRVVPLGDSCLSVVFEEKIDPDVNRRAVALAAAIERQSRAGIRDVVPAYHTVAVYFDPLRVDRQELMRELGQKAESEGRSSTSDGALVEVPVHYGEDQGPDLSSVAAFAGCSEDEVVRIHTSRIYRVYMLGFLPGFAYLGSVDPRIAMPRLDTPRLKVPAGSVGIAGIQTGIYPCDTPGGWRIIGRTGVRTFDPAKSEPFLFEPGQRVQFVASSRQ